MGKHDRSELDAAGVRDPALRDAYRQCRSLNAEHGRTFFLATRLLAPEQRPAVHALYGFAGAPTTSSTTSTTPSAPPNAADRLQRLATQLFNRLVQNHDSGDDPALAAVVHTARKYGIPGRLFDDFLASMRMDLTVTDYPDRAALDRYMYGSAEVIGLQLLPVLGTVVPARGGRTVCRALGKAFQLTNFLRDVDEDLQRGRVYLPADELAVYQVDRDVLTWCHTNKRTDARVRRALTEQHADTRRVYEFARNGIDLLAPAVAALCVGCAHAVLGDPGSHRGDRLRHLQPARHRGHRRRLQVAGAGLLRAWRARLRARGTGLTMDRWQYLIVLARAWRSRLRWRSSGAASTGRRGGPRALCCRSRRCSWCGTRRDRRPRLDLQPAYVTGVELPASMPDRGTAVLRGDTAVRAAHLQRRRCHPHLPEADPNPSGARYDRPRLHPARRAWRCSRVPAGVRRAAHRTVPPAGLLGSRW